MSSGVKKIFQNNPILSYLYRENVCDGCRTVLNRFTASKRNHIRSYSAAQHYLKHQRHNPITWSFQQKYFTTRFTWGFHRKSSTTTQTHEAVNTDPFSLVQPELSQLCDNIKQHIVAVSHELECMSHYHFDGAGKAFRPMMVLLTAKACNYNHSAKSYLLEHQQTIAQITEMIHVSSLVHDDVIDASDTRRGKPSVHRQWGQRKAIMLGDFLISQSSQMLARIGNPQVVTVLSQVLEDLVKGEFMQLGSKENETERFNHYLRKTFKKTASLVANSCKAVAILGNSSESVVEIVYQYGKNTGIAFQLVDDLLDFISSDKLMGKPTAADLKLGLATAPVLFAAQQYPELDALIMRRFTEEGDIETARSLVAKSDGVDHTRMLAEQHCKEARRLMSELKQSEYRDALINVTNKILHRMK